MNEIKEITLIFIKNYFLAILMTLPITYGIYYATQGKIALSAILLASGLVGTMMTNISIKEEFNHKT